MRRMRLGGTKSGALAFGAARAGQWALLLRPPLALVAIWLLVASAMFPRGYMPARSADGFTIVLCSAVGLTSAPAGDAPDIPRRHIGSVKCDALGPAPAILPPAIVAPAPPVAVVFLATWAATAVVQLFRAAYDPNAPPTAPPA